MPAAYFSRHALDRVVAVALTLVIFGESWFRHASFRSTTYDLAVFEQVVWKMANGHGATSSLTAWNAFADHLSPILLVFVPLYRVAATPLWFFAAQALAAGVAVLCVRPLAKAVGLDENSRAATFLIAAFALHPAVWNAALYDFHPTTLAVPVLLLACHAGLRNRHWHMWLALIALVVLRDDLALAGAAAAVIGWRGDDTSGRRQRALMIGAGFAWTVLGAQLGAAMGASRHFEARYGYLGASMTDAAMDPINSVVELVRHLLIADNLFFAVALLLPLAFLPLRRPGWLGLAAFVLMPALVSTDPNFHSPQFHYGAPAAPFLLLGAAGGLHSLRGVWNKRLVLIGAPLAAVGFFVVGPPMSLALTKPTVNAADARAALDYVRPGDAVAAGTNLGPHVAYRETLLPFPFPFTDIRVPFPLDERVKSTDPAEQDEIDVILASNISTGAKRLINRVGATPEVRKEFIRTDIGTVTVFRRRP